MGNTTFIVSLVLIATGIASVIIGLHIKGESHIEKVDCYDRFSHKIVGAYCEKNVVVYSKLHDILGMIAFLTLLAGFVIMSDRN